MNLLILLEDNNEAWLVEKIKDNKQFNCEISNIDFNLTKSIEKSQVILFLGDKESYQVFIDEYQNIANEKMIIHNILGVDSPFLLTVEMKMISAVGICKLPNVDYDLKAIIIETLTVIFEGALKLMMCDNDQFSNQVKQLEEFELELKKIALKASGDIPRYAIEQVFKNIQV